MGHSPHFDPAEVQRIAASYPPEAATTTVEEREQHLSPLQRHAWLVRFRPTELDTHG